jgi:co-chaperonin GroES (HSP10)
MNDSGLSPLEFFVIVKLDDNEGKIGSIFVPPTVRDKDDLATQEGTLIAVSPHAFTYADKWPEGSKPEVGQRVLFKRYAGHLHERNGSKWRVLNDKDLVAIIETAPALSAVA